MKIDNYKVISVNRRGCQLVYVDSGKSITRHAEKMPTCYRWRETEEVDATGDPAEFVTIIDGKEIRSPNIVKIEIVTRLEEFPI